MKTRRGAGQPGTVLVVDPDDAWRRVVRKWLEAGDFLVLDAGEADDAERIARLYVGPIHLVLIDASLATTAGGELVEHLVTMHAELQTLLMSVRPQSELARKRELAARHHFLRKPFTGEQLVLRVNKILTQTS